MGSNLKVRLTNRSLVYLSNRLLSNICSLVTQLSLQITGDENCSFLNRMINSVGSFFFRDRIFRFGKNMPQSLKRFLSNFNVVAIQNSLDGFCNTLKVRNNSKTSRWFPFTRIASSCNLFLAVTEKSFFTAIRL